MTDALHEYPLEQENAPVAVTLDRILFLSSTGHIYAEKPVPGARLEHETFAEFTLRELFDGGTFVAEDEDGSKTTLRFDTDRRMVTIFSNDPQGICESLDALDFLSAHEFQLID